MVQDKAFVDWHSCCCTMSDLSHQATESQIFYIVQPIEKRDSTELFITITDCAFNFSNTFSMIFALYFLELDEESIIRMSAVVGSTPISSRKA